jgi:hypothetical protein
VGFGFERFDAIGRWRATENGKAVDAAGVLRDVEQFGAGTSATFSSLPELGAALVRSDRAADCFATTIFRHTRGRLEHEAEACTVRQLAADFRAGGRDVRALLVRALADERFLTRVEVTP